MRSNPITPEYGPLHGLRVMLTGVAFAGPFAARWLGDMGAVIIKIVIPVSGDTAKARIMAMGPGAAPQQINRFSGRIPAA